MGKRSREKGRERRRLQKRKKLQKQKLEKSSNHSLPVLATPECVRTRTLILESPANQDSVEMCMPRSCTDCINSHASDSRSCWGDPEDDSPLFDFDSPPSSPPTTPSVLATAKIENASPVIVVDEKRKLEVHISDPDYERLPGAEILKLSTEEYFRKVDDHKRKTEITIRCLRNKIETLEKELSIKEKAFKMKRKTL